MMVSGQQAGVSGEGSGSRDKGRVEENGNPPGPFSLTLPCCQLPIACCLSLILGFFHPYPRNSITIAKKLLTPWATMHGTIPIFRNMMASTIPARKMGSS